jgi:TolA-binding protein
MSADLKEPSIPLAEISQGPNAFEAFLDRNQKGIVVLAILLCIGAVGLVVYRGIEKSREESAGIALNKANDTSSYQAVVKDHPNTIAAGSAMTLLANSQWSEGKKDDSIATLQKFLQDDPEHPAGPTAKASLGAKLMAQGKNGDAAKVFEEVTADPAARYVAPFALISLGDISKAAGDLEKAETFYSKVRTDFADSSFADAAGRRIAILKAKPPVEIDPPAPKAPATSETPPAEAPAISAAPTPEAPSAKAPKEAAPPVSAPKRKAKP